MKPSTDVSGSDTLTMPNPFQIDTLHHRRLTVLIPFVVMFDTDHEIVIARAQEIDEFGFGRTCEDAIKDLEQTICQLYFDLEERQNSLGPEMQRVWDSLRHHVRKDPL